LREHLFYAFLKGIRKSHKEIFIFQNRSKGRKKGRQREERETLRTGKVRKGRVRK
jgi:hypothetical protein